MFLHEVDSSLGSIKSYEIIFNHQDSRAAFQVLAREHINKFAGVQYPAKAYLREVTF